MGDSIIQTKKHFNGNRGRSKSGRKSPVSVPAGNRNVVSLIGAAPLLDGTRGRSLFLEGVRTPRLCRTVSRWRGRKYVQDFQRCIDKGRGFSPRPRIGVRGWIRPGSGKGERYWIPGQVGLRAKPGKTEKQERHSFQQGFRRVTRSGLRSPVPRSGAPGR
jgi:hypothetical protein